MTEAHVRSPRNHLAGAVHFPPRAPLPFPPLPFWCFTPQNYFYPDTPKNYQITQYDRPIAEHGEITLPSGKKVRPSQSCPRIQGSNKLTLNYICTVLTYLLCIGYSRITVYANARVICALSSIVLSG